VSFIRKSTKSQASAPLTIEAVPATDSVRSVSGSQLRIGESVVTNRAKAILRATDEGMAWQERPSLVLLIPRLFKYFVIMIMLALACLWFHTWIHQMAVKNSPKTNSAAVSSQRPSVKRSEKGSHAQADQGRPTAPGGQPESPSVFSSDPDQSQSENASEERADRVVVKGMLVVAGFLLLKLLLYALRLKSTHYSASSQRLFVEEGTFHTVNRSYELHQLGNAVLVKPFLMRPFGVANLAIGTPLIVLYGLRNASAVRDLLRTGGQLEAQRVDKIRWR
jgi:Bacterial PH domain